MILHVHLKTFVRTFAYHDAATRCRPKSTNQTGMPSMPTTPRSPPTPKKISCGHDIQGS